MQQSKLQLIGRIAIFAGLVLMISSAIFLVIALRIRSESLIRFVPPAIQFALSGLAIIIGRALQHAPATSRVLVTLLILMSLGALVNALAIVAVLTGTILVEGLRNIRIW